MHVPGSSGTLEPVDSKEVGLLGGESSPNISGSLDAGDSCIVSNMDACTVSNMHLPIR